MKRTSRFSVFFVAIAFLFSTPPEATAQSGLPQITSIDYPFWRAGASSCLHGIGFGATQGTSTVAIDGTVMTPDSWTDAYVCLTLPSGATLGAATAQVTTSLGSSNVFSFTITGQPAITSVSPTSAVRGAQVTITGTNFGPQQYPYSAAYWLGDASKLTVVSWSDTQVVGTLSANASLGSNYLQLTNNGLSAYVNFAVLVPPQIANITPASGGIGTQVTIVGANFGTTQGGGTVTIGGVSAQVLSWSDSQIVATVAVGAATGSVVVVQNGITSNAVPFTLQGYLAGRMEMTPWDYPQPDYPPINLSDADVIDWAYWGLSSNSSVDRKNSTGIIGNLTAIGPDAPTQDQNCFDNFTWSNGDVNPSVSIACAGLMMFNTGEGFQVTVPADTTPKTLKLYVGIEGATAKIQAHLSDRSAAEYIDSSLTTDGAAAGTYIIDFQAGSPGQALTVSYTLQDLEWGEVTVEAAVLTPKHPDVAIVQPAVDQTFTSPAAFTASVQASQVGSNITNVSLFQNGSLLLTLSNPPFDFSIDSLGAGNYQLTAQAVDSNGLSQNSQQVPVHVAGSGGELVGNVAAPPSAVDLTQQGTADWILLGRDLNIDADRKANVAPLINSISDQIGTLSAPTVGPVTLVNWAYTYWWYDTDFVTFSAEDGIQQFSPVPTGFYFPNPESGLEFAVKAGLTERTVNVYVAAIQAQGEFEAYLSDGSAPFFVDTSTDTHGTVNEVNQVYTLRFQAASEGQKLIVRYNMLNNYKYGGVVMNAVAVDGQPVYAPVISSIWPTAGGIGIPVYIVGEHFGANQGQSYVSFNGTRAPINYWSDNEVDVTVPSGAASGPLVVNVNGFDSNSVNFQIVLGNRAVTQPAVIVPDVMYLNPGDTKTVQLLDPEGNAVLGATWIIKDPNIAQLSTDDPPQVTAKTYGDTTLTAVGPGFSATAEVHVIAPLAVGSGGFSWSIYPANNNTTFFSLTQAQPYGIGGPDFYAAEEVDGYDYIHAYTVDGGQLWQKKMPAAQKIVELAAMNQGGVVATLESTVNSLYTLATYDQNGNAGWSYASPLRVQPAIHPNGLIYVVQNSSDPIQGPFSPTMVALDQNGNQVTQISLPSSQGTFNVIPGTNPVLDQCVDTDVENLAGRTGLEKLEFSQPKIAADGSLFLIIDSTNTNETVVSCQHDYVAPPSGSPPGTPGYWILTGFKEQGTYQETLSALEISEDGSSQLTTVQQFPSVPLNSFLNNAANQDPQVIEQNGQDPNFMIMANIRDMVPDNEGGAVFIWDSINPASNQFDWYLGALNKHYISRLLNGNISYTADRSTAGYSGLVTGENGIVYLWDNSNVHAYPVDAGTQLWSQPASSVISAVAGGGVLADLGNGTATTIDEQGTLGTDLQTVNISSSATYYADGTWLDIGQQFGEIKGGVKGPTYRQAAAGFPTRRRKKGTSAAELPLVESFAPSPIYFSPKSPDDHDFKDLVFSATNQRMFDLGPSIVDPTYNPQVGSGVHIAGKFFLRELATKENLLSELKKPRAATAFIGHTVIWNTVAPEFAYGLTAYYPKGGTLDVPYYGGNPASLPSWLHSDFLAGSEEEREQYLAGEPANRDINAALNRLFTIERDVIYKNGNWQDWVNSPWTLRPDLSPQILIGDANKISIGAKILFLGSCGIDEADTQNEGAPAPVLQMFDIKDGQAIVASSQEGEVDLGISASAWGAILQKLSAGYALGDAIDSVNQSNPPSGNGTDKWVIIPDNAKTRAIKIWAPKNVSN